MGLQLDSGNADLNRPIPLIPPHVQDAVVLRTMRVANEQGWSDAELSDVLGMLFDPIKRGQ